MDLNTLLQIKIAFVLAYFPTICFSGWLQAFLNKKIGDDTAANEGFMTLDPGVHFDPFGFFILVFPWQFIGMDMNFGFGKRVPINVDHIHGKFKTLRTVLLIFTSSISYLIATILVVPIFGILKLALIKLSLINVSNAILLFGSATIRLCASLFLVYTVIGFVNLIIYSVSEDNFLRKNQFGVILLILVLSMLLMEPLDHLLSYILGLIYG